MNLDIRTLIPEDRRVAADVFRQALLFGPATDEDMEKGTQSWEHSDGLTAWDGERCVGHVGAFRFRTAVPGGRYLDTSAVTRVGILPTHTRRGLLTQMMTRLLREARDRGQPLASLRASEAVIYGRFGFGLAGEAGSIEIDCRRVGVIRGAADGSMRLLTKDEPMDVIPPLFAPWAAQHGGGIDRDTWMWERLLRDFTDGKGDQHVAVHVATDGTIDGFVHYSTKWNDGFGVLSVSGSAEVKDLFGASPEVRLALWQHVTGLDLVESVRAETVAVDDPIRWAVTDYRAVDLKTRWDEQWVRLLDVDTCLRARSYSPAVRSVTISVHDPLFSDNCSVWSVGADGAERRDNHRPDDADLSLDIRALSALYMGGHSWTQRAMIGDIDVRDRDALAAADLLFSTANAPLAGTFF